VQSGTVAHWNTHFRKWNGWKNGSKHEKAKKISWFFCFLMKKIVGVFKRKNKFEFMEFQA